MPWPEKHKGKTRERILAAAAAMFQERGIEQTSVADVMQQAGLTHGGFYAHFHSKEALVAEAVAYASAQLSSLFMEPSTTNARQNRVLSVAEKYLSPLHLEHPERGCPIAALGPELIRSGQKVRRVVSKEVRKRLDKLYEWISPEASPEIRRRKAAGALACMVGGLILARSLRESEGLEFLKDCERFLQDCLE